MEEQFDVFAFAGQSNADGHFFVVMATRAYLWDGKSFNKRY